MKTLWEPSGQASALTRYLDHLDLPHDYERAWRWSVDDIEAFWATLWDWFDVGSPYEAVVEGSMPGAVWFPGATLNFAERALRGDGVAVVAHSQTRPPRALGYGDLREQVTRCRAGLARLGVKRGDRVVGYLPNIPEATVAFLATASLGAIWASCPPEFGVRSVVDRFGQLDPKVLLAVGGYRYGDKSIDRGVEVATIRQALPSLVATVEVPYHGSAIGHSVLWHELLADADAPPIERVPFDHPLYVLFSSGTTGLPKAIVHGHGGILIEHLKSLVLQQDIGPGDRFFWFTTTGWMMWNYLMSGLIAGATIVLYDGDPGGSTLWDLARETSATVFGVSAPFLMNCRKQGIAIGEQPSIRSMGSTGAPLPAEGFRWVYEQLPEVWLASMSGGTDVCAPLVGGAPLVPVYEGEISCRYLGAAVAAFDEAGTPVVGEQGELVVTKPMPSMPVGFWGDDDGTAYRAAYFDRYRGVWCHGDWITITERGSSIITGRSDATLNRGGVRLGTSEFYAIVEALPGISDSLVLDIDGRLLLFVVVAAGASLDRDAIVGALRRELSPRHAPDEIHVVRAIPRTHSGKKLEIPVKRILAGTAAAEVVSLGALSDPSALADFERIARGRAVDAAASID